MGLPTPESLLNPFGDCLKNSFNSSGHKFPEIGVPGMPPILLGAAGAMLGPAVKILDFIPPNADIVPDIEDMLTNLPKIVINGFIDAAIGLPKLPISVLGIDVSVGDVSLPITAFDPTTLIKFVGALILAPFNIFKGILESLIKLKPRFPDLGMIKDILNNAFKLVGIPAEVLVGFIGCLSNVFLQVINAIKP